MLNGTGVHVDARNLGQNGDGPDTELPALMARDSLGDDLQFLFMWWAMIPFPAPEVLSWFAHQMTNHGVIINAQSPFFDIDIIKQRFGEAADSWGLAEGYGWQPVWFQQSGEHERAFKWFPSEFWGRQGDGRCHLRTRGGPDELRGPPLPDGTPRAVGTAAIIMQNWHQGPMGFQLTSDSVMTMFADALELATFFLESGLKPDDVVVPPTPPSVPDLLVKTYCEKKWYHAGYGGYWNLRQCERGGVERMVLAGGTGMGPTWTGRANLANWIVPRGDKSNPFPLAKPGSPLFEHAQIKRRRKSTAPGPSASRSSAT